MTCEELGIFRRVSVGRLKIVDCAFRSTDDSCIRLAQPRRRLDKGIQHRLQIESRPADDLEHVGGGGLLLQRLAQLVEQSGVLDSDDGLRGEVLDQIYLLIIKGADLLAIDSDRTNQVVLLEHRYDQ